MKESLLELDPEADALLILQKPNAHSIHDTMNECASATSMVCHFQSHCSILPVSDEDEPAELTEVNDDMRSLQPHLPNGDPNQIVFRVSAKHLCLASPVFQRMIHGKFKESEPNDQGLLEIRTSEWDAEALLILLDIIHGHHSSVPKRPSLDVIAQIGVIADYYDCLEVVRIFFQQWNSSMKIWEKYLTRLPDWGLLGVVIEPGPRFLSLEPCLVKPFDDKATIGLLMAWIVQDKERFRELTACAVLSTNSPLETALPIPARIIEAINNQRCQVIDDMLSLLYNLKDDLAAGLVGCNLQCSGRLLGNLSRQMQRWYMRMTKPERPFERYSVVSLDAVMGSLGYDELPYQRCHCAHTSRFNLSRHKKDLRIAAPGLDLNDFQ